MRKQIELSAPLYARRAEMVALIPNFWPLVLEQAPMDIDQYIWPSDSALLMSSLRSLSVSHFELDSGDPRSVSITFEFAPNDMMEDDGLVVEKKFWYRRGKDGWAGLISKPVAIKWKKGKDLTGGLLKLTLAAYESVNKEAGKNELTAAQKALKKKIKSGVGAHSFFTWFGYIGRRVGDEESRLKTEKDIARREKHRRGEEAEEDTEDECEEDDVERSLEIFDAGEALAMAISEDLWPGAIRYFSESPVLISP